MKRVLALKSRERRTQVLSGSILSVLALALILNQKFVYQNETSEIVQDRGVASMGGAMPQVDSAWQSKLAYELEKDFNSDNTVLGRKPQSLDQFQYGALAGRYGFEMQGDQLKRVFPLNENNKLVIDNKILLQEMGKALAVGNDWSHVTTSYKDKSKVEVYASGGKQMKILRGPDNRLVEITVN